MRAFKRRHSTLLDHNLHDTGDLIGVCVDVSLHVRRPRFGGGESLFTVETGKGRLAIGIVRSFVDGQRFLATESLIATRTRERFQSQVSQQVTFHVILSGEALSAFGTSVWFDPAVRSSPVAI